MLFFQNFVFRVTMICKSCKLSVSCKFQMHVKIEIDLCGSKIVQTIDLIGVGKHNDDLWREFFLL